MQSNDLHVRRVACETILRSAGQVARARFIAGDFTTDLKGAQDFVSEVDRTTEQSIKQALQDRFQTDEFLGEESGGGVGDYGADDGYSKGNAVLGASPLLAKYFSELTGVALAKASATTP